MKRFVSIVLAALLALGCLTAVSLAEGDGLLLTATVESPVTVALKAPATGELMPFTVRAGDVLHAGDTAFTVAPQRVYADIDGTVAAVYAQAGDIADAAVSRYGAVLMIDHANRYQIMASNRTSSNTVENRDLHVGMPVYVRSSNEKYTADGRITAVDGSTFVVEVLGGDLVFTQEVKVYRDPEYKNLLSRTHLSAIAPYAVAASGTITEMAVQPGDTVHAGDYLFSFVPDSLDPERRGTADATAVKPAESLIVTAVTVQAGASVQKGQPLLTAVPLGVYELRALVEEGDVPSFAVGDVLNVRFEELNALPVIRATVTAISPLGIAGDVSRYEMRLAFDAPEGVWPGMHATLER